MRRLIIETGADDVARLINDPLIANIDSMEVLNFLREDPRDFAVICRLRFKDPKTDLKGLFKSGDQYQLLEQGKDGSYTFYYRGRPDEDERTRGFWKLGGYLSTPYEIRDGRVKLTFLGSPEEVKSILEFVQKWGITYKVDLLTDAKFSADSPLARLTDKQRKVLTTAFDLGYYDLPRKINSAKLAKKLGIKNPTFVIHRRKAERQVLAELFREA